MQAPMQSGSRIDRFALREPFAISRGVRTHAEVLTLDLRAGAHHGWAECTPYARYGETAGSVAALLADPPPDRATLQEALPPGAARNALDCALWDLAAQQQGRPVWALAGLARPRPVPTVFTLSLAPPAAMERAAAAAVAAGHARLKIKLGTPDDLPRLESVRRGAPRALIAVDANEGWDVASYTALAPHLLRLGVAMVEQPLPADQDEALRGLPRPVPVCADESLHSRADLPRLAGLYDMVNIKLDKAGGLTEALALHHAARAAGFGVMVGCMMASSLGLAPAVLVAQGADLVDLDAPLLLAEDRTHPLRHDAQGIHPSDPQLWGHQRNTA